MTPAEIEALLLGEHNVPRGTSVLRTVVTTEGTFEGVSWTADVDRPRGTARVRIKFLDGRVRGFDAAQVLSIEPSK
jgi:hypothetical protein